MNALLEIDFGGFELSLRGIKHSVDGEEISTSVRTR